LQVEVPDLLVHLGFVQVHERRELTMHVLRLAYSFLSSAGLGASLKRPRMA